MKKLYLWDDWFKRRSFRLRRGRDFTCSALSMAQQVRSAASNRRISVSIREVTEGLVVWVGDRNA